MVRLKNNEKMRICILCEDDKVEFAREKAKAVTSENSLKIPLSKNGEEPTTHWLCSMEVTEEGYRKIMDLQQYTEIEISSPLDFLRKKNLKIIKKKD